MIAIPFSLALNRIALGDFPLATMMLIGSIGGAVCLCTRAAGILKQKDPQFIVIDTSSASFWPIFLLLRA